MVFHIIGRPYNSVNIDGKFLDCSSIFDYAQPLRRFSLQVSASLIYMICMCHVRMKVYITFCRNNCLLSHGVKLFNLLFVRVVSNTRCL